MTDSSVLIAWGSLNLDAGPGPGSEIDGNRKLLHKIRLDPIIKDSICESTTYVKPICRPDSEFSPALQNKDGANSDAVIGTGCFSGAGGNLRIYVPYNGTIS